MGCLCHPLVGLFAYPRVGTFFSEVGAKDASSMGLKEGFCIFALGI